MSTYMVLTRFTEKGVEDIKDVRKRIASAKEMVHEMGGEVKELYGLLGEYDTMLLIDAPDDLAMAKMSLAIGHKGNVHTETLPAFSEEEFENMADSI